VRHRAWGLLVLVPAAMFIVVLIDAPYTTFHPDLYLSGSPDRFAAVVVSAGRSDARGALWLDNLFVLSWLAVVPRLLRAGLQRWAPERRRLFGVWVRMPAIALAAAVTDAFENALSLFLVGKTAPPTGVTLAIATLAWSKWLLYAVAVGGLVGLVIGPLLAPVVRPALIKLGGLFDRHAGSHPPVPEPIGTSSAAEAVDGADAEPDGTDPRDSRSLGICVSGGGVRAASVALGALRRLDAPVVDASGVVGPSLFQRSRWLVAVSGGAYVAGGWRVSRHPGADGEPASASPHQASPLHDGLFDADHPWAGTVREKRRFLDNGALSIVGGILNLVVRSILVFGAIASACALVGWLAGSLVPTRALHPDFPFVDASGQQLLELRDLMPARLMVPGATLVALAGVSAIIAFSSSHARRLLLLSISSVLVVAGALLLAILVGVPIGVVYGRRALNALPGLSTDGSAGVVGLLSTIGLIGALVGILVAQLKRRWMRLGGVFLAIGLLVFTGKVADTFAWGYEGMWRSWPLPFTDVRCPVSAVAAAWLIVINAIASHRLTLGGVYRKRLAITFALDTGDRVPLPPLAYEREPLWPAYRGASGPELIIAATAHASADTFCGLPAFGFTFRPSRITMHDRVDDGSASVSAAQYPIGSWWEGYPRGWLVTRSMALSGAAFASAMGRQALGTTNSLLVALNLRLGAWVPNPRFSEWFADRAVAPRVHLGYLAKELFGRYHPDRDAFVYVADGGHRENLGLVELLREHPDLIVCVDASGDQPDSFTTLREAIELAITELGVDIDIDLGRLSRRGTLPLDCAAKGTIKYPDGTLATLLYAKSQLSESAMPSLLQYGAIDDRFPNYSTIDQNLTDAEHMQLVALGAHMADRMITVEWGEAFRGVTP
jgi:hypothetical protein